MKKQLFTLLIIIFTLNLTAQKTEHKSTKKQKKEVITNDNPFLNPKSYQTGLDINYDTVDFGQDITNDDYLDEDFNWNNAYDVDNHRAQNQPSTLLAIVLFIILILAIIVINRRKNNSKTEFNLLKKKEENSGCISIFSIIVCLMITTFIFSGTVKYIGFLAYPLIGISGFALAKFTEYLWFDNKK